MGFGSYDESEQESQDINNDEDAEGVSVHENDHNGEINFETGASSTKELVDQLDEIRGDSEQKSESK